ncbi:hypothetical protein FB451DRAFT_1376817 [Mycena latifolia]|nr:hypothetical protein FB451DRAFT_1376817 [Mycena latifolia]
MSSPFTSKLGTNYCPQDAEIAQIQTLLIQPTLRLKRLDDEIAVLQKALDKLTEERTGIGAYVDAHKALISTVRRLPLDVVQEIFTACIPTHRNYLFDKKLAQRAETTKMWLGRSGNCPLSISLKSNGLSYFQVSQNQPIPALLSFASRWEHISFTAPLSCLGIVSHLTEADVPMLKSVSIDEPYGQQDAIRWDSFGFLRAPKISSFSLKGGRSIPMELPLRWNGLINLSITKNWNVPSSLTSETALQVLSRCPQLRTCDLFVDDPPGISQHQTRRARSRTLVSPYTRFLWHLSGQSAACFGWVSFPQLRNLKLRGISDIATMSYVRFLATAPLIEKLDIINGGFSQLFLASFLRELPPTLRELNFSIDFPSHYNASFDDEILESFIPSVDLPSPCCPGLQVLEIQYSCAISDKALLRFIRSRTLKRVVIRFDRAMELDIRPELQSLIHVKVPENTAGIRASAPTHARVLPVTSGSAPASTSLPLVRNLENALRTDIGPRTTSSEKRDEGTRPPRPHTNGSPAPAPRPDPGDARPRPAATHPQRGFAFAVPGCEAAGSRGGARARRPDPGTCVTGSGPGHAIALTTFTPKQAAHTERRR